MFARSLSFLAVVATAMATPVQAQPRGGSPNQTMPSNSFSRGVSRPVQAAPRTMAPQAPAVRQNAPAANYSRPQPSPRASAPPVQARNPGYRSQAALPAARNPDFYRRGTLGGPAQPSPRSARPAVSGPNTVVAPGSTVNNYTTINRTVNNYYNGGSSYGYNYGYPAWSGNGWGGWGWGWRGGCPGCWYSGISVGIGFVGGYVVGSMLAQPVPAYVMPVAPTGAVLPSSAAPQMEPVQAYSSSPAWVDRKTGLTCADRTVQRPDQNGSQYLYTAKFCVIGGVWQEYSFAP